MAVRACLPANFEGFRVLKNACEPFALYLSHPIYTAGEYQLMLNAKMYVHIVRVHLYERARNIAFVYVFRSADIRATEFS